MLVQHAACDAVGRRQQRQKCELTPKICVLSPIQVQQQAG